ncbi:wall-associated receptor kinase 2-like [Prunus yedoensis var. nudiflora]|uniref:Wall-associated receptor kinase 2-like n=1 Tax=Prunus yedoensis var. nudiflora TaxID=2094558 RepID=A0A314UY19_PRUYE|nr:wall-associated receptor kinase 2-like [Prunus yedoensis var. nudiflora]
MGIEFRINCTADGKAYLWGSNIRVTNISVDLGEIQIQQRLARDCYDEEGNNDYNVPELRVTPPYTISGAKNKFMAVGCDTYAAFEGFRWKDKNPFFAGCMSRCFALDSVNQTSCSGIGCCQTSIPDGLTNRTVDLGSFENHTRILDFNKCSYAFIVQEGQFSFSNKSFDQLAQISRLPMILNWDIGEESCESAAQNKSHSFACKVNSKCVNRTMGKAAPSGYICQCWPGYQGNPYHPDGCQDVDECKDPNACEMGKCVNTLGNYTCTCPKGYRNTEDLKKCISASKNTSLKVSLGVIGSFCVFLVLTFWLYCGMKRRKFKKEQEKNFKQNGGLLLRRELASYNGTIDVATIFTEEELKKATNNYDAKVKIGEGGYGEVYKGTVSGDRKKVVAIKKPKLSAPITESQQFANEIILLSQINHKHVVRLLGCCLETQTPILVYEFISNGTLHDHIHGKDNKHSPLSLELRLKIAADTAEALSYLHHSTNPPIVHRDVKAMNILLDENYRAKVADFGASRLVPQEDQNNISTLVQGTLGYLDPEYLQTHILTEKSDVYSFGVVLVELLTSQKALTSKKNEAHTNLANVFVCAMKEGSLDQILDAEIVRQGHNSEKVIEKVAGLAMSCLSLRGEERPSMKNVAIELGVLLQVMGVHQADFKPSPEDTDYLLGSPAYVVDVRGDDGNIINSAEYDQSMQLIQHIQLVKPYGDGR